MLEKNETHNINVFINNSKDDNPGRCSYNKCKKKPIVNARNSFTIIPVANEYILKNSTPDLELI